MKKLMLALVILGSFSIGSHTLHAQSKQTIVKNFEDAAKIAKASGKKGNAQSCPYSDYRSKIEENQRKINAYCKGSSYGDANAHLNKKKKLNEKWKKARRNWEAKDGKRMKIKSQLSNASNENQKKDLKKKLKEAEEDTKDAFETALIIQKKYDSYNKDNNIQDAIKSMKNCSLWRKRQAYLFKSIMDRLYNEPNRTLGSSASDEQKKRVDAAAKIIYNYMKDQQNIHINARKSIDNRIKKLEEVFRRQLQK